MILASTFASRWTLVGLAWAVLLQPAGAWALTLAELSPLYFDGAGGFGSSAATAAAAGEVPRYSATANDRWISPGSTSAAAVRIQQQLTTEHQNPGAPNSTDPVIADSTWTIENLSAGNLVAPLLVFTSVDPAGVYPAAIPLVGIDGQLVDLVAYSFGGVDYWFGAAALGNLGVGESVQITVRYIVGGALAGGPTGSLPPLGVKILGSYTIVPEPTTALMVVAGLLGLAVSARRRS